jgi:hypothetical protein
MVAIEYVRVRLQKLVCGPVCTEFAVIHSVRIRDITARTVDVLAEVLLACLSQRGVDS